jgi:hypothetical protein
MQTVKVEVDVSALMCPHCGSVDSVKLIDLGPERDAEGEYGNFRCTCFECGWSTCDMDTAEDAVYAFITGLDCDIRHDII